jgi:hypothetical protein
MQVIKAASQQINDPKAFIIVQQHDASWPISEKASSIYNAV